MIRKLLKFSALAVIALSVSVINAQSKSRKSHLASSFNEPQQALYTDYKGVRIGMTADEVHSRLGKGLRVDEQEFFVFSDRETAQVAYDAKDRVKVISVDYLDGVGAPDYRTVVGSDINIKPDGSMYKLIRYERLGFWVSYNRTANSSIVMVTITISAS